MPKRILIIGSREYLEKAQKYLDYLPKEKKFEVLKLDCPIFADEPIYDPKAIENYFKIIFDFLAKYSPGELRNFMVIFDIQVSLPITEAKSFVYDVWNPLLTFYENKNPGDEKSEDRNRAYPRAVLISWLFLTFPEVQWYFLCENSQCKSEDACVHLLPPFYNYRDYFIQGLGKDDKTSGNCMVLSRFFNIIPLFDFPGLRNSIRRCIKPVCGVEMPEFPLRHYYAASIDEEEHYAYLHGYLAYKIGYKCLVVTDQESMGLLSKEKKEKVECDVPAIELAFEDLFLNFPDRSQGDTHLSNLSKRDEKYDRLKDVSKRILVTVGHKNVGWYGQNQDYIKGLRAKGKKVKIVYKPSSGMYNILEKSGLLNGYWKRRKEEWKKAKPGSESVDETGGHSSPGRLLLIAEKLIDRARRIFKETETVQDCIQGATLALEAVELLGYRTPTTALEAIALRHKLEVKAECMFYGIEYNIDVKNRIREIKNEVKTVSLWFHPKVRKRSILDAQMRIITDITRIFHDAGQFDEELVCLNYLRKLNRRWSLKQPGLKKVLNYLIYPLRSYIETLVGSFRWFFLALVGWPLLLGILGKITNAKFAEDFSSLAAYISNSLMIYFGLQSNGYPQDVWAHVLTILILAGGFLHLGIFISYLYTLITRR
jgi:hypothetical protein